MSTVPSLECQYNLSEEFQRKASNELREDVTRRTQALAQFREWIEKQSHIKKCRSGLIQ